MLYVPLIVALIGFFVLADYLSGLAEKERTRNSVKIEVLCCLWIAFMLGLLTMYLSK